MFRVRYHPEAAAEVRGLRAHDRARVLDAIERNLLVAPLDMGRQKKQLDLGDGESLYQLRIGEFRVFYDVDEAGGLVVIRHVVRKGRLTTREIT